MAAKCMERRIYCLGIHVHISIALFNCQRLLRYCVRVVLTWFSMVDAAMSHFRSDGFVDHSLEDDYGVGS